MVSSWPFFQGLVANLSSAPLWCNDVERRLCFMSLHAEWFHTGWLCGVLKRWKAQLMWKAACITGLELPMGSLRELLQRHGISPSTYLSLQNSSDKSKAHLSLQQPVCEPELELSILPIVWGTVPTQKQQMVHDPGRLESDQELWTAQNTHAHRRPGSRCDSRLENSQAVIDVKQPGTAGKGKSILTAWDQ